MKQIVIASNNPGKLREIRELLAPLDIEVLPQSAFDVPAAEEPHDDFKENALIKARHASKYSGLPALADDSGICVDVLEGGPGPLSARYAGEPKSDERNNLKLLQVLHSANDRRAHYYCVLVLVRSPDDPQPLIAEGSWHGEISHELRGANGFGYDPLFYLPHLGKTAAELPPEVKNQISHRGKALKQLVTMLQAASKE
ncbi:MAG TPA: RdgB/HAM1 family non-canonical purine NTP pyrophosphatase [Burkholderiales bacterium]|nr:RdgB/HAM1 family non-canonical purine NTP pyrophosphatase [Burkholderiales bacterium]